MEWISIKNELPTNHNEQVLVATQPTNSYIQTYICTYDGVLWWNDDTSEEVKNVTDWCIIVLPNQ